MSDQPNRKLVISLEAGDEILNLSDFYLEKGKENQFLDSLGELLSNLESAPFTWQFARTKEEGIRRALLKQFPVIILYVVTEKEVRILSVKDARSDWLR